MQRWRQWLVGCLLLSVGVVSAQSARCPEIVDDALDAVDTQCSGLQRNQACYGNVRLNAQPQPCIVVFPFDSIGDIVDVAMVETLDLSPMDESAGVWGLAVMSLQANIPNTLPGQNVTFLLFGDVTIENAASDEQVPMQTFFLRTGVSDAPCEEAPESGLLVQTPDGVEEVTFNVNGVDVQISSTVLFQAESELTVTTIEGTAVLDFVSEIYPAIEGTQIRLPLNDQRLPIGRPSLPEAYDADRLISLPTQLLERVVEIEPPLSSDSLEALHERLQEGQLPCGVGGLPSCDTLPRILRDVQRLPQPERWGLEFVPGENCILQEEYDPDEDNPNPPCPPLERLSRLSEQVEERLACLDLPGLNGSPLASDEDREECPDDESNSQDAPDS